MIKILIGFLQLLLISYMIIYEFNNKSSAVFIWGTLFLIFGVPHFLDVLIHNNIYDIKSMNYASIFVIGFILNYYILRIICRRLFINVDKNNLYKEALSEVHSKHLNILFVTLIIVIFLKITLYLRFTGGILNSSWAELRNYVTNNHYLRVEQIIDILYYSLGGVLIALSEKRKKLKFIFLIAAYFLTVIITRNRIEMLPGICAIISIYIFKSNRINFKSILFGIFVSLIVIYLVYGFRAFRYYGTIDNFIKKFDFKVFNDTILNFFKTDNGELGLRKAFYYFISNENNFEGFGKGLTYIRLFFLFIPSKLLFGLKPQEFALIIGKALGMPIGGSFHPTLFGDSYANCGMFGMFLGIYWAIYTTICDFIALKSNSKLWFDLVFVLSSIGYVIISRGSVYNGSYFIGYGILINFLLKFISDHFYFKKNFHGKKTLILKKRRKT